MLVAFVFGWWFFWTGHPVLGVAIFVAAVIDKVID